MKPFSAHFALFTIIFPSLFKDRRAKCTENGLACQIMPRIRSTEDQILTPTPTPDLLSRNFCLEPDLRWKFLLRRTWLGQKTAPTAIFQDFHSLSKGKQVALVRIHFSHPESDGKSADLGVGRERKISPKFFRPKFSMDVRAGCPSQNACFSRTSSA